MMESQNQYFGIKVSSILRGLAVSLILLLVGNLFLGLIINFTNVVNNSVSKILFIVNYIAIFIGGSVSAYSAKGKGWINGGFVGLIYMIVILLLGFLWNPIVFSISLVTRLVIGFIVSALGGVVGVNVI